MKESTNRIESLDSIRGIAAVVVLIYHCLLCVPLFHSLQYGEFSENSIIAKMFLVTPLHTLWAGEEAVILFFILSGFVLSMPFLNSKEFILNNYLIKRFCRIYLPYIFVMFISTCLMIFMSPYNGMPNMTDWFNWRWSHKPTLESIASYIFMLGYDNSNVNGPAWSLVHELRISIIFPLIMLFVVKPNTKKAIIISLSIITFACTLLYGISSLIPEKISIVFLINSFGDTLFYSVFFIIGALFAKYRENFKSLVIKRV